MDLARALANEPPMRWLIGRITAISGATLTMSYRGGLVEGVAAVDHYTPVVGDIVHVLASDSNGMLAIGANNQPAVLPVTPTPSAPVAVAASSTGTYRTSTGAWTASVVEEAPDLIGCWIYPAIPPLVGLDKLPVASLAIRITAPTPTPLEFVLHGASSASGSLPRVPGYSYRIAAPPTGIASDVPLPLEWATMLVRGQAAGIGVGGGTYTATLTGSSGLLTFTPLL